MQVSQLLQKLRTDLHLSFHSFLKEFVAEPNDGVSWFLQRGPPCPVESSFWSRANIFTKSHPWWNPMKERTQTKTFFKVTLLLDLLKMIQLSQTNSNSNKQSTEESSHRQQVSWNEKSNVGKMSKKAEPTRVKFSNLMPQVRQGPCQSWTNRQK